MDTLRSKAFEITKELLEERFEEDCIEELINEEFDVVLDFLNETIWEELEYNIDEQDKKVFEKLFYDTQDDFLRQKREDHEEERMIEKGRYD